MEPVGSESLLLGLKQTLLNQLQSHKCECRAWACGMARTI